MKRFSKMLAVLSVLAIGLAPFACSSALIAQAISGVSATPSSATQVTVTWRTSVESTSQVEYGLTTDYGLRSTLDSTSELIHIVNLTDLTGGIAYHFRVISKETGGKETISDDFTFITPGLPPALTISNIKVADTSISSV